MNRTVTLVSLTSILILISNLLLSQNYDPLRVEFQPEFEPEKYEIVPAGKEKMILFKETDDKPEWGERYWEATAYNGKFEETWNKKFSLNKKMKYVKHYLGNGKLHIFFLEGDEPYKSFRIVSINEKNGNVETAGRKFPQKLKTVSFNANGNKGYITGTSKLQFLERVGECCVKFSLMRWIFGVTVAHNQAFVFEVDWETHNIEMLKQHYDKNAYGVNASLNPDNTSDVFIAHMEEKFTRHLYMKTYGENANLKNEVEIRTQTDNALISGQSKSIGNGQKLVIGPYAAPPDERSNAQKGETKYRGYKYKYNSLGFYVTKFEDQRQQFIKYFNLKEDFENFSVKENRGFTAYASFVFVMHDIIVHDDQYILVAENYKPIYTITYSDGVKSGEYLSGFRPTNAIAMALDKNGKKLWDNAIEIQKKKQGGFFKKNYKNFMSLDKNVTTKINKDGQLVLIFADNGKIFNTVIEDGEIVSQQEGIPIPTKNRGDGVKHNFYTNLNPWYENYYIAWGYQKIDKARGGRDKYFYFNKIALEDQ